MEQDKTLQSTQELPLIRTLPSSGVQLRQGEGDNLLAVSVSAQLGTALSASGIYVVLKRFFAKAAKTAAAADLDPARFEKASTHWMRHTFVRQALVDAAPIEVASELVGHASFDTTSIYSTQELARKIKAVQGMKRRVVA